MFTFRGQWVSVVVMMGRLGKKETVGERRAGRIIFQGKERRKRMEIFWKKNQRLGFFKGKKGKMSTKKEDGGWEEGREKGKEKEERKDERGQEMLWGREWQPLLDAPLLLSCFSLYLSLHYSFPFFTQCVGMKMGPSTASLIPRQTGFPFFPSIALSLLLSSSLPSWALISGTPEGKASLAYCCSWLLSQNRETKGKERKRVSLFIG